MMHHIQRLAAIHERLAAIHGRNCFEAGRPMKDSNLYRHGTKSHEAFEASYLEAEATHQPPVSTTVFTPEHKRRAFDLVRPVSTETKGEALEIADRLEDLLSGNDTMHPVGCSEWEERARVAIDMAKDFILARPIEGDGA